LPRPPENRVLKEIGQRVHSARVAAGFTQEAAAHAAGIDYKRFQRVEAGEVNVTVRTIVRIAEALGVTFWQLLGAAPPSSSRRR
jgi:transcriptional regulator with XRE-family HTH domain